MISRNHGFVNLAACTAICVALGIVSSAPFVAAQSSWQAEWENAARRRSRVAVGSLAFVEKVKTELGIRALHRELEQVDGTYALPRIW